MMAVQIPTLHTKHITHNTMDMDFALPKISNREGAKVLANVALMHNAVYELEAQYPYLVGLRDVREPRAHTTTRFYDDECAPTRLLLKGVPFNYDKPDSDFQDAMGHLQGSEFAEWFGPWTRATFQRAYHMQELQIYKHMLAEVSRKQKLLDAAMAYNVQQADCGFATGCDCC